MIAFAEHGDILNADIAPKQLLYRGTRAPVCTSKQFATSSSRRVLSGCPKITMPGAMTYDICAGKNATCEEGSVASRKL